MFAHNNINMNHHFECWSFYLWLLQSIYALWRESWARRQISQSTGPAWFLLSSMAMKGGSWPKESDRILKAEMRFLRRMAGISLRDNVRSSAIRQGPLLLCVERSQLRWFWQLVVMSPSRPAGRGPRGWPRTRWRDYISMLAWESLGWCGQGKRSLLELFPSPDNHKKMDGWIENLKCHCCHCSCP